MKKIITLLVLSAIFFTFFNSCSKYEDGPALSLRTKLSRISGTWNLDEVENNSLDTVQNNMLDDLSLQMIVNKDKDGEYKMFVEFLGNKMNVATINFVWDFDDEKERFVVTVNENDINFDIDLGEMGEGEEIEIDNAELAEMLSTDSRILRLTNKELWLENIENNAEGQPEIVVTKFEKLD